jgi:hypothetical protein
MGLARVAAVMMLGLVLVACAPSGYYAPADPAALRLTAQAAEALAGRVEESLASTRAAQEELLRQTAEAVALQATQRYEAEQRFFSTATAKAVQESMRLTEMARSAQAFQGTATAQAVMQEQERSERQKRLDEITAIVVRILGVLALMSMLGVLIGLMWQAGKEWIRWQSQRWRLVESRAGTLVILPEGAPRVQVAVVRADMLPPQGDEDEFGTELAEIPYSVNGEVVGAIRADWREEPQRRLVLRLLREAMQVAGPGSTRLPGWRELGWSAEMWSRAVETIRPYVETSSGRYGGTYLVGGYTLHRLYQDVGARKIALTPSPAPNEEA